MDTSEFENTFLGQPAIISINGMGDIVGIKLKMFPNVPIQISDQYRLELEKEYEDDIREVLKENYQDAKDQEDHIRLESDKGKFV